MIGQMLAVLRRRWALTVILVVALEGGMFWGAFTFVSTDLHQRFGLGFAAIGLAVAAFGGGGFLYVMVAHHWCDCWASAGSARGAAAASASPSP
jgi:predicted MFS family arabinose efflux permease